VSTNGVSLVPTPPAAGTPPVVQGVRVPSDKPSRESVRRFACLKDYTLTTLSRCVSTAILLVVLAWAASDSAHAQRATNHPACSGAEAWAPSLAFVHLKNAGLADNDKVDFTKTKVVRLASEQIGKDLYRQIHDVKFSEKSGGVIEVMTMNDASHEECSMSGVDVFIVSRHLGGR